MKAIKKMLTSALAVVAVSVAIASPAWAGWTVYDDQPGYRLSVDTDFLASQPWHEASSNGPYESFVGTHNDILRIEAKNGFQITSLDAVAEFSGSLWPTIDRNAVSSTGMETGWSSFKDGIEIEHSYSGFGSGTVTRTEAGSFSYFTTISTAFGPMDYATGDMHWWGGVANGHIQLKNITFAVNVTPVPEPETYAMLLAGLGLMGAVARRRKQKNLAA